MRAFWISLGLCVSPIAATATFPQAPVERLVQFGLETLQTGARLREPIDNGRSTVEFRVLRTWKSRSGHYCRQYELNWLSTGAKPETARGTRCRNVGGGWKSVED